MTQITGIESAMPQYRGSTLHPVQKDAKPKPQIKITPDELSAMVKKLDKTLEVLDKSIRIRVEADMYVAEIYDKKTHEVIKTIPAERIVALKSKIQETLNKLLDSEL